ncbi:hypothetical protein BHAMNSH16_06815 [Brachyspira hampsonii]|uniref:Uncharacterized protein n=1 Tax=Brachyspira hampsonii TaxID=1287055 RepID=A0AAC9TV39_9SPIR|nr:hypothetical protein BHAMNSH16_06815 [Brachyspira hampsonii]MBW5379860.1 hypothetical protein [Brachyspira hampsonii]OEJ17694.1 hypothetical protein A9496_10325 [Brachyspira hampsonii]
MEPSLFIIIFAPLIPESAGSVILIIHVPAYFPISVAVSEPVLLLLLQLTNKTLAKNKINKV